MLETEIGGLSWATHRTLARGRNLGKSIQEAVPGWQWYPKTKPAHPTNSIFRYFCHLPYWIYAPFQSRKAWIAKCSHSKFKHSFAKLIFCIVDESLDQYTYLNHPIRDLYLARRPSFGCFSPKNRIDSRYKAGADPIHAEAQHHDIMKNLEWFGSQIIL